MIRYFPARFFDGERPVPAEGRLYATETALHFDSDDRTKCLMFTWDEVTDARRDAGRVVVTVGHPDTHSAAAHREIVCADAACWNDIHPRLVSRGALRFRLSGSTKRVIAGFCLAGMLFAVILWAFITQSYRLVPADKEAVLGQRIVESMTRFSHEYKDTAQQKRIEKMLGRIHPKGSPYSYRVYLIDDRQVNAFAVPGGGVIVFRGLLDEVPDDSELAGVLAHEASHVELRHGLRQMIRYLGLSYVFHLAGGAGLDQVQGISTISDISSLIVLFKYSRGYELEADANAVKLSRAAGYDPRGITRFLERMQKMPGMVEPPAYISTHPATAERIRRLEGLTKK